MGKLSIEIVGIDDTDSLKILRAIDEVTTHFTGPSNSNYKLTYQFLNSEGVVYRG